MIEIKISGRGGQGVVLASQILASAFFEKGFFVQSFPSFGAERRGAPVSAFLRVDSQEVTLRYSVQHPDWIVLFDAHLLENLMVMAGLDDRTSILVNSGSREDAFKRHPWKKFFLVNATAIAEGLNLKTTSFSIVNTAMVGAFAKVSSLLELDCIVKAIGELVPVKREENTAAAREAFQKVREME